MVSWMELQKGYSMALRMEIQMDFLMVQLMEDQMVPWMVTQTDNEMAPSMEVQKVKLKEIRKGYQMGSWMEIEMEFQTGEKIRLVFLMAVPLDRLYKKLIYIHISLKIQQETSTFDLTAY